MDNSTYEVRPLEVGAARAEGVSGRIAHVIRRASVPQFTRDDTRPLRTRLRRPRNRFPRYRHNFNRNYTIEIALFIDEAAYKVFFPFFNYNEAELRDMLLAYINGVSIVHIDLYIIMFR